MITHTPRKPLSDRPSLLRKRSAGCLLTVAGTAAFYINVIGMTLIVGIVNALHCLAVNADRGTGMHHGALEGIHPVSLLQKALTAGSVTVMGMLSAHHDVSLAAQMLIVVGTVIHRTFQFCHNFLSFRRTSGTGFCLITCLLRPAQREQQARTILPSFLVFRILNGVYLKFPFFVRTCINTYHGTKIPGRTPVSRLPVRLLS